MDEKVIISKSKLTNLADTTRKKLGGNEKLTVDEINDKIEKIRVVKSENAYVGDFKEEKKIFLSRFTYNYFHTNNVDTYCSNDTTQSADSRTGLWHVNRQTGEVTEIFPLGTWTTFYEFEDPLGGDSYTLISSSAESHSLGCLLCRGTEAKHIFDSGRNYTVKYIDDKGFYLNLNYYYNLAENVLKTITYNLPSSTNATYDIIHVLFDEKEKILYRSSYYGNYSNSSSNPNCNCISVIKNGIIIKEKPWHEIEYEGTMFGKVVSSYYNLGFLGDNIVLLYFGSETTKPLLIKLDKNLNLEFYFKANGTKLFDSTFYNDNVFETQLNWYYLGPNGVIKIKKDLSNYEILPFFSPRITNSNYSFKRENIQNKIYFSSLYSTNIYSTSKTIGVFDIASETFHAIQHPSSRSHYFGRFYEDSKGNIYFDSINGESNSTESIEVGYLSVDDPYNPVALATYNTNGTNMGKLNVITVGDNMVFYKTDTGSYNFFKVFLYGVANEVFKDWPSTSQNSIIGNYEKNNVLFMWTGSGGYSPVIYYFNFNNNTKGYVRSANYTSSSKHGAFKLYGVVNDTVFIGTNRYDSTYSTVNARQVIAFNTKTYEQKSLLSNTSSYTVKDIYNKSLTFYGVGNIINLINTDNYSFVFDEDKKVLYIMSDTNLKTYRFPVKILYVVEKNNKVFLYPNKAFVDELVYFVYNPEDNSIEYHYIEK